MKSHLKLDVMTCLKGRERQHGKEKDLRMVGFRQVIKNVEGYQ